jgi:hypothetical protein
MKNRDSPTLIVQHIVIQWTKSARGGRLAELRNKTPHALGLPTLSAPTDNRPRFVVHRVDYHDQNEFTKPFREQILTPLQSEPYLATNCSVKSQHDSSHIHFVWSNGAPTRTYSKKLVVEPETCTRVEYNARFAAIDDGGWNYSHEIVNATVAMASSKLFIGDAPGNHFSDLQALW